MSAKICPRCGAQYENLRSTTCPQCFAKLLLIDEATAEELSAARAQVEQTPEFQEAKAEDDERYREQSFGACLGVAAIFLVTLIGVIALLVHAVKHDHRSTPRVNQPAPIIGTSALTPLPVAAATRDDVLPAQIDSYKRVRTDQFVNIPGTLTPIFHAVYADVTSKLDVYAVPGDRPTPELNTFQLGLALASHTGTLTQPSTVTFFATEHWRYGALGVSPLVTSAFQEAMVAQFSRRSRE